MKEWLLVGMLVVTGLLMMSSGSWAGGTDTLGMATLMQPAHGSVWSSWLPVAVGGLSGLLVLVGLILRHSEMFMSIMMVAGGIAFIGLGIPALMALTGGGGTTGTGLVFGATPADLAAMTQQAVAVVHEIS